MSDVEGLAEDVCDERGEYFGDCGSRVEDREDRERLGSQLPERSFPVFQLDLGQVLEHAEPVFIELGDEARDV